MSFVGDKRTSPPTSDLEVDNKGDLDVGVDAVDAAVRHEFTYADSQRLKRKVDLRMLPLLTAAYLIKNMASNMPSNLKTMNTGTSTNILTMLNMTVDDYGYLSTLFICTYVVFEIPSNFIIKWATPRLHFVRILAAWSIICACHAACTNKAGLFACRCLLGFFEAGLWPGIVYHVNCWYRPDEVAVRVSGLQCLGQFSGIMNSFIAYGLAYASGKGGLAGWQWCFLVIGIAGILIAGALFMWLPDYPDSPPSRRQFLTEDEGRFMAARLPPGSARSTDPDFDWPAIRKELKSPLLYGFGLLLLFEGSGTTGLSFWLPSIIQGFGLTSSTNSQLMNIPPAAWYCIVSVGFSFWMDRDTRVPRPLILMGCMVLLSCVFIGLIFCTNGPALYFLIFLSSAGDAIYQAIVFPLRAQTSNGSSSAAFVFSFANSVSLLSALYSAQIFQDKYAPQYAVPFAVCIVFFVLAFITCGFVWYWMRDTERETRMIARKRRAVGKAEGQVIEEDVVI